MTRAQTEHGVQVALQNLAKKSVRKACSDAGISVTTLYNKTTPEEREEAIAAGSKKKAGKKRGRPAKVQQNPSIEQKVPNTKNDKIDFEYVAKLQKHILDNLLD